MTSFTTYVARIVFTVLFLFSPAGAVDFSFQPRLEAGLMQYSFESGPISMTFPSELVESNSGFNFTQQAYEYDDHLLVLGAGGTLFLGPFFIDFSGQFANEGKSSATVSYSGFYTDDQSDSYFLGADPLYEASFDRTDVAVALGYSFSRFFSLFAGYKMSKTKFDTTYEGRLSSVAHYSSGTGVFDSIGGRIWGDVAFDFEYQGPFVGAIQGWDFTNDFFIPGVLTGNLALAYLDGEVVVEQRNTGYTIDWVDGYEIPEIESNFENGSISNRLDTVGDALGITLGISWRGSTSVDGLSYSLIVSGYRYEFEAEDNAYSDINETAVVYKAGLSYAF